MDLGIPIPSNSNSGVSSCVVVYIDSYCKLEHSDSTKFCNYYVCDAIAQATFKTTHGTDPWMVMVNIGKQFQANRILVIKWSLYASHLVLFAYFGVIARILLVHLFSLLQPLQTNSPLLLPHPNANANPNAIRSIGDVLFPEIFANAVGCFLMGLLFEWIEVLLALFHPMVVVQEGEGEVEDDKSTVLYRVMADRSFTKRIYTGLSTGFCGCLTTFSSWQFDAVVALSRGSIVTFIFYQLIGLSAALNMFLLGRYMGIGLIWCARRVIAKNQRYRNQEQNDRSAQEMEQMHHGTGHTADDEEQHSQEEAAEHGDPDIVEALIESEPHAESVASEIVQELRHRAYIPMTFKVVFESMLIIVSVLLTLAIIVSLSLSTVSLFLAKYSYILCMAPLGCLLRFLLCKGNRVTLNNKRLPFPVRIPIFTLLVNVIGSIVLVAADVGLLAISTSGAAMPLATFALQGITVGFAGSFTTVSTFVQEIHVLHYIRHKCIYLVTSILLTDALLICIIAPVMWTWPSTSVI